MVLGHLFGYAEKERSKCHSFSSSFDKIAGQMDHIRRTPEGLQAAASNRSADGPHRPSSFSLHLFAIPGAISITFMSPRPGKIRH
jgi:hypothetical protein